MILFEEDLERRVMGKLGDSAGRGGGGHSVCWQEQALSAYYSTSECRDLSGSKISVETAGTAEVILSSPAN